MVVRAGRSNRDKIGNRAVLQTDPFTPINTIERIFFALFMAFILTGGMPFQSRAQGAYNLFAAGGTIQFALFFVGCGLAALYFIFIRLQWRILKIMSWPMVTMFAWAAISITWAYSPLDSLRILGSTIVVAITTIGFVSLFRTPIDLMKFLFGVLLVALIINYATVLLAPSIGIHQSNDGVENNLVGRWRGMMLHKNLASYMSVIGAMVSIFLARQSKTLSQSWTYLLAAPLFILFAVMAGGKTSTIIGFLAVMVAPPIVKTLRRPGGTIYVSAAIVIMTGLAGVIISQIGTAPILTALFGDATLTGRTIIWHYLLGIVQQRPIIGAGYESIWGYVNNMPLSQAVLNDYVKLISNSHNTYLDILATMGAVGLVIALVAFIIVPIKRIKAADVYPHALTFFMAVWLHAVLIGATDIVFLKQMRMQWIFFLISFVGIWMCMSKGRARNLRSVRAAPQQPREQRDMTTPAPVTEQTEAP